jgi:hypothetical protein
MATTPKLDEVVKKLASSSGWTVHEEAGKISVEISTGRGRRQVVAITRDSDLTAQEIIRYSSVVGDAERVDLGECLRQNAKLAHGAFAILDGKLVLLDTQLAASADATQIAAAIGNIAANADRYEKFMFGQDVY